MGNDVVDVMKARVARGELPGLVTLVARGEETQVDVIGKMGFGDERPMRRDTLFRIASLTKPITAVAVMMLAEDGAFSLDEPVDRLLPELAEPRVLRNIDGPLDDTVPADRPITVEDLLTFRMGLGLITEPSYNPPYPIVEKPRELNLVLAEPDPRTPHEPDEWMRRFGTLPLMDQPGTHWRYNPGSLLQGVLIARASGMPFADFLKRRLFDPLGMGDTGFHTALENTARIPRQYMTNFETGVLEEQPLSKAEQWTAAPPFPSGSSGLLSTVDDYHKFARMMLNRGAFGGMQLLPERTVEAMTVNHLTQDQIGSAGMLLDGRGWGYGLSVVDGRYGWEGGSGTVWFNDPSQDATAIALTQNTDFLFNGSATEFIELALKRP
ncbi:serine hydrolase domain-containing protein [Catelliglobosispora koreensis]|uniref:serine hydrolase domain-containing protein n=1 Tax=Catelliglobosispora koreensis TaxID=129052 RepID=UPI000376A703|nr:serine hydrolase domain-containing protein [Catelliglobosispora koreensis]